MPLPLKKAKAIPSKTRGARAATAAARRLPRTRGTPGSSTINALHFRRLTAVRKLFRRFVPDSEAMRSHRLVTFFGGWLTHPRLWHLNGRSVPGAVAIGLFAGLLPGPVQMLTALLLAAPLRQNVPLAMLVTLYTNPLTIVPLYVLAFEYGNWLLCRGHGLGGIAPFEMDWSDWGGSLLRLGEWCLAMGKPLALGLLALALTLAALGYIVARVGWRVYVTL